jgi:hypothetical protein
MADRIAVPLPDGRWLALAPEAFREALEAGSTLVPCPRAPAAPESPQKLVSAEDLEQRTGVPASWFATQARERRIPFHKLGRYVRFSFEEVMACDAFRRRAIPSGEMHRS